MTFDYTRRTICKGADCDTEHYLVFEKIRGRLTESKQAAQNFGV